MVYAGPENNGMIHKQHWTIRTQRYRYIRYNNGKEELYDHQKDPNEWTNLAENPECSSTKAKMKAKLMALLPKENMARAAKSIKAAEKPKSNDYWKKQYFKKNPSADTNGDGELSWQELNAYKKK